VNRALLAGVVVLLAVTLATPLWSTRMVAPQYKGDEALVVDVYAGRVHGDVDEIELLNQYVAVRLPLDTPELAASVWVLGFLLVVALVALALPSAPRRRTALALGVAMIVVLLGGGALLQYRLYQMGHVRGDAIMEGVDDFTPPILGSKQIANFTVHMSLGIGGWAYLGALLLAVRAGWKSPSQSSVGLRGVTDGG
jgi:hypothetical protein